MTAHGVLVAVAVPELAAALATLVTRPTTSASRTGPLTQQTTVDTGETRAGR